MRAGGRVSVIARRERTDGYRAGVLHLQVIDTGGGMTVRDMKSDGEGLGLSNIESRLALYYGTEAIMTIRDTPGGGTTVDLCVPFMARDASPVAGVVG
jgi:two-component system sensor histidine kinase YesM